MVASSLRSISPSPISTRDPAPYGFYDARLSSTTRSRSTATSMEDDDALEVLAAPISLRVDHHLDDDLDNFLSLDLESMQQQARRGRASYDSCGSGARRSFSGQGGGGGGGGKGGLNFGDDLPGAKARKILGITAGFDLGLDDDDDDGERDDDDEIHGASGKQGLSRRRRNSTSTSSTGLAPAPTTRNKKRLSIVAGLARRGGGAGGGVAAAPKKEKSLHLKSGASERIVDQSGGRQRSNSAANSIGRPGSRESSHNNGSSAISSTTSSLMGGGLSRHKNTLALTGVHAAAAQTEDEASATASAAAATSTSTNASHKRDLAKATAPPAVSLSLKSPLSPLPPPSCDWTPPSNWLSRSPSNHSQSSLALPTTPSLPRTSAEGFLFARTSSDISMPMTPTSSSGGGPGGSGKKSSARFDAYLKRLRAPRGSHSSASTTEGGVGGGDDASSITSGHHHPKTPSSSLPPPLPSPFSVSLRDLMLWEKSLETSQKNAQWQSMVEHRPRLHRQRPISSSNASSHSSIEYGRGSSTGGGGGGATAPSFTTSGSASASASASTLNLFDNDSLLLQHGGWASSSEEHGTGGVDVVVDLRSSADYERRGSLAPYPFCASHREDEAFELLDERMGALATSTTTAATTTTPTEETSPCLVRPPLSTSKSMPVGLGIQGEERSSSSSSVDGHGVSLHPFKTWDVTSGDVDVATKRSRGKSVDVPVRDITKAKEVPSTGTPALVLSPRRGAASSRRSRLGGAAAGGNAAPRPPPQAPLLEHHLLPPPAVPTGQVAVAASAAPVPAPLPTTSPRLAVNEDDADDDEAAAPLFDPASEALLLELEAEIRYASTASVPLDSSDLSYDYDDDDGDEYEQWLATAASHGHPRKAPLPPVMAEQQQQSHNSVHEWPRRPSWAGSDVVSSSKSKRMSALEAWAEAEERERGGSSAPASGTGTAKVTTKTTEDGLLIILPPCSSYGDVKKATAATTQEQEQSVHRLRVPA